jgi:thioredoxin-dependent peroxiredoxin
MNIRARLKKYYFISVIMMVAVIAIILLVQYSKPGNMENIIIKEGVKAPDFTLPSQDGSMVSLSQFAGLKSVVLFFYPKDESYGCTKEACSFRDNYEVFKEAGAEVIGISADDEASHKSFASNHKLPFILLSDKDRKVAGIYKVGRTLGLLPGRVTYVIDRNGIIQKIFSSQFSFEKHMEEALMILHKGIL